MAKKPLTPFAVTLTGKQARHLRALAHEMKPVVQVGKNGLTDGLCLELDSALLAHELLKVRFGGETPASAEEFETFVNTRLGATVAQVIGKIVLIYRAHPDKPRIKLPSGRD